MKRAIVFLMVLFAGVLSWAGEQKKDVTERLQMATDVLKEMSSAPDKGIPEEVLDLQVEASLPRRLLLRAKHIQRDSLCSDPAP